MIVNFTVANLPAFDKSEYLAVEGAAEMLDRQFVRTIHSPELHATLKSFMANHFDQIVHISGHYAPESDMYYYAIYGLQRGVKKADFITVAKELFDAGAYYNFAYRLPNRGSCRRGNGYAASNVCQGKRCDKQPEGCLGMICPPAECL